MGQHSSTHVARRSGLQTNAVRRNRNWPKIPYLQTLVIIKLVIMHVFDRRLNSEELHRFYLSKKSKQGKWKSVAISKQAKFLQSFASFLYFPSSKMYTYVAIFHRLFCFDLVLTTMHRSHFLSLRKTHQVVIQCVLMAFFRQLLVRQTTQAWKKFSTFVWKYCAAYSRYRTFPSYSVALRKCEKLVYLSAWDKWMTLNYFCVYVIKIYDSKI